MVPLTRLKLGRPFLIPSVPLSSLHTTQPESNLWFLRSVPLTHPPQVVRTLLSWPRPWPTSSRATASMALTSTTKTLALSVLALLSTGCLRLPKLCGTICPPVNSLSLMHPLLHGMFFVLALYAWTRSHVSPPGSHLHSALPTLKFTSRSVPSLISTMSNSTTVSLSYLLQHCSQSHHHHRGYRLHDLRWLIEQRSRVPRIFDFRDVQSRC